MAYEEFLSEVLSSVKQRLPKDVEASLRKIQKNNSQILDGLVLSTDDSNASPTIYLNPYYEDWSKKRLSTAEICSSILEQYKSSRLSLPLDVSFFTDFEQVKEKIIFRIVNKRMNEDLLSEIPHIDYLDLAITFLVLLSVRQSSDATILIRNSHLPVWNVDTEDLFSLAKKNTPRLLAWDASSLSDILDAIEPQADDISPSSNDIAYPMYVLTNQTRLHGASCILYDNLLSSLSKKIGDDLYIIPSSIHEVLLIPQAFADTKQVLDSMICEVNETQVARDEILSDHAYLYSRKQNKIFY